MADVVTAGDELRSAAAAFNGRRSEALQRDDTDAFGALNRQLLSVERAFLDAVGIPGRPWYRHLIYAPKFTYAPELLPGVAEAVDAADHARAQAQAERLAIALRKASALLRAAAN